ncbi:site-specific recombination directionality factor RDF [Erwinia phage Ea9-2]|uniref:Lipoprotein n=1 Tax=Erwinia phage Ea9-2 TaxID=1429767 RepID=W6ARG3_9CAUD|nr:site-specific recombination directionality factor RDF [Erwinia phage Ea9-2]AHI60086.1 hypothetical protein Ea92_29 [Erwinia phage Ea9-2]
MRKFILSVLIAVVAMTGLSGCDINDADVVSKNLSTDAANFKVNRRIVFTNLRTGEFLLSIEGLCARENTSTEIQITCQTGPNEFKKHFMGLTTEVSYFVEQTDPVPSNKYRYTVTFKPSVIVPTIELR